MAAYGGGLTTLASNTEPGPNFQLIFAPLLFGVLLNVMLFGVFLVQVHSYFRLYKGDTWIRYLIYYLILLEVVNTVCDIGLIYEPLITLHGTQNVPTPALQAADPIVTTLISTPTQLFMAWRVRLVTKSGWPSTLVALLAFTSLAGGLASTILLSQTSSQSEFGIKSAGVVTAMTFWLTSAAFADLFITTFLVNFLWKSKTGFQTQTDSVADKIIFFTVQTGAITSIAAIADVTTFLIVPNTTINFVWDFSLSKMYSICLIATLNSRAEWNTLVAAPTPAKSHDPDHKAIVRVRRATDIEGLQLYIPSQFEFNGTNTPRRRTPHSDWIPPPLPLAAQREGSASRKGSDQSEIMQRTAEWVKKTVR